ncbi:DUF3303 domain-containing protein [Geodermatophilus sp. SYSU D00758]
MGPPRPQEVLMGQMYLHRFTTRDGVSKAEVDAAWTEAFRAFARSGNWGGVESGITHHGTWGDTKGGFILVEADDPAALARYQAHHLTTYAHVVDITIVPVYDMDEAFRGVIDSMR